MADFTVTRTTKQGVNILLFSLPDGTKMGAYFKKGVSIDFDGDPRSYGSKLNCSEDAEEARKQMERLGTTVCHNVDPLDSLGNAGWGDAAGNRKAYDKHRKNYDDYEAAKAKFEDESLGQTERDAAKKTMDGLTKRWKTAKKRKANEAYDSSRAYWTWYGLKALKPGTEHDFSFREADGKVRHPVLMKDRPSLIDANGEAPVIQSEYEPMPGHFVSVLATALNTQYKDWDQRHWLYPGTTILPFYAVLGDDLAQATGGTKKRDVGWCMSTASGLWSSYHFIDWKNNVGEISWGLFSWLGGQFRPNRLPLKGINDGDIPVLYLAFPGTNNVAKSSSLSKDAFGPLVFERLRKFKAAGNSADIPILLTFLSNARANENPITLRDQWSQGNPGAQPSTLTGYPKIFAALGASGFV